MKELSHQSALLILNVSIVSQPVLLFLTLVLFFFNLVLFSQLSITF